MVITYTVGHLQTLRADVLPNCSWSDNFRHEVARTLLCLSLFVIHVFILINSSSNTSIMTIESQFITMPVLKTERIVPVKLKADHG